MLFKNCNTNNKFSEKEIDPIYNGIKTIKCLGINITKEEKDIYSENYITSVEEIKETGIVHSWVEIINIVKISILPKPIYTFNAITIKTSMAFSQK